MEQQTAAAHAFFLAHKDRFQYEKYVSNEDPFQNEHDKAGRRAGQSFLEQYREIDREQPAVPALSNLHFSLLHPPTKRFSITSITGNTAGSVPMPGFVSLASTASVLEGFNSLKHDRSQAAALVNSPQRLNGYKQPQSKFVHDCTPSPQDFSPDRSSSLQQQRSAVRVSDEPKLQCFALPKLAGLLIDRETRAAATAHKSWDEAHKIEVLVGGKCVGRMSAASRNVPSSIRARLRASAKVSVRRERLYDLLRSEYEALSKQ
jgi:hypothetical protein